MKIVVLLALLSLSAISCTFMETKVNYNLNLVSPSMLMEVR